MKNPKDRTKVGVSGKKTRWRIWSRRREITTGKFPPQRAWREWEPTETVFGEDEYSNHERWVSDHQTNDREYAIRPEPDDNKVDKD